MDQLSKDLCLPPLPMGYLSAPISADTAIVRSAHHLAALAVSAQLWEAEVLHYCPHRNSPQVGTTDVPYESWLAMDLEVLKRCNYLVMAGDWHQSAGCRRELAFAMALHLPVVYTVDAAIAMDQRLKSSLVAGSLAEMQP